MREMRVIDTTHKASLGRMATVDQFDTPAEGDVLVRAGDAVRFRVVKLERFRNLAKTPTGGFSYRCVDDSDRRLYVDDVLTIENPQ